MSKPAKAKPHPPVVVATASVTDRKLNAIVELSKATAALARALESTHVKVDINGCQFYTADATAIQIGGGK